MMRQAEKSEGKKWQNKLELQHMLLYKSKAYVFFLLCINGKCQSLDVLEGKIWRKKLLNCNSISRHFFVSKPAAFFITEQF